MPDRVDAVDHQSDGRVQRLAELPALPDAPDLQETRPGRSLRVVDVGHHVKDLVEMGRAPPCDGLRRDDGDARGHPRQVVPPEGGANHDFLDDRCVPVRRRGRVRGERGRTGDGGDGQGEHGGLVHLASSASSRNGGGGRCFHGPIPPPALSGSGSKGPRTASASQALRPPLGFTAYCNRHPLGSVSRRSRERVPKRAQATPSRPGRTGRRGRLQPAAPSLDAGLRRTKYRRPKVAPRLFG